MLGRQEGYEGAGEGQYSEISNYFSLGKKYTQGPKYDTVPILRVDEQGPQLVAAGEQEENKKQGSEWDQDRGGGLMAVRAETLHDGEVGDVGGVGDGD